MRRALFPMLVCLLTALIVTTGGCNRSTGVPPTTAEPADPTDTLHEHETGPTERPGMTARRPD